VKYVEISKNIIVNPERVDAIELTKFKGETVLYVYISGKRFVATIEPKQLLNKLANLDITKQFWVG